MDKQLQGKKVLILVANGVDEKVMSVVQREMLKAGAEIKTVGIAPGLVNSWNDNTWGLYFPVDSQISTVLGSDFDCLVVPSGSRAIQKLGGNAHAERIISSFITAEKRMAFIGDAVELLAKTALAKDWKVSGPERVREAMTAAGAQWQGGSECVHNILMSGEASDTHAFVQSMISYFADCVEMKAAA
jgi:protease I